MLNARWESILGNSLNLLWLLGVSTVFQGAKGPRIHQHVLHVVSSYGLDEVLKRLLSTGIGTGKRENALELEVFGATPLMFAISDGFARTVQCLLDFGVDIETRCGEGATPLGVAARLRNEKVTRLLLDRGAEIEARDNIGWTALSHAAQSGKTDITLLLLGRGADIETRDISGCTPLSHASSRGMKDFVQLLLDRGAEIETLDKRGRTPLSYGALRRHIDVVQLLLDRGAEVEKRDDTGQTPLSLAADSAAVDVMQLLLDREAEIETRDDTGRTPLSHAAEARGGDIKPYILGRQNVERLNDKIPIYRYIAPTASIADSVRLLLDRGAEIEARDGAGRTPLCYAVKARTIDTVQLLLEGGAEIEARDNGGRTPLSHAAESAVFRGSSAMVRFLLTLPTINIGSEDDEGLTAIDWAEATIKREFSPEKTPTGPMKAIQAGIFRQKRMESEKIVAILKAALLERTRNLLTDGGDGTTLPSNVGHSTC